MINIQKENGARGEPFFFSLSSKYSGLWLIEKRLVLMHVGPSRIRETSLPVANFIPFSCQFVYKVGWGTGVSLSFVCNRSFWPGLVEKFDRSLSFSLPLSLFLSLPSTNHELGKIGVCFIWHLMENFKKLGAAMGHPPTKSAQTRNLSARQY